MAISSKDAIMKQIEDLAISLEADNKEYAICIKDRDGTVSCKNAKLYANQYVGTEMAFIEMLVFDIIDKHIDGIDGSRILRGLEVRMRNHNDQAPEKTILQ